MKTNAELESLVALSRDIQVALSEPVLGEIADLVLRLHLDQTRRAGAILPAAQLRTYRERSETEREGMRAAVKHVTMALILLEVIELPT